MEKEVWFRFRHNVISCGNICYWLRVRNMYFELIRRSGYITGIRILESDAVIFRLRWAESVEKYEDL